MARVVGQRIVAPFSYSRLYRAQTASSKKYVLLLV